MADTSGGIERSIRPKVIIAIVLGALALVFVFQNTDRGRIDFLFWSISMPAWIWILIVLAVGVIIGSIFPLFRPRKRTTRR